MEKKIELVKKDNLICPVCCTPNSLKELNLRSLIVDGVKYNDSLQCENCGNVFAIDKNNNERLAGPLIDLDELNLFLNSFKQF